MRCQLVERFFRAYSEKPSPASASDLVKVSKWIVHGLADQDRTTHREFDLESKDLQRIMDIFLAEDIPGGDQVLAKLLAALCISQKSQAFGKAMAVVQRVGLNASKDGQVT